MSIRTRRARNHSKTHIVGFSIAGFFGFLALLGLAFFISLSSLVDLWLQDLPNYKSSDAYLVAEPTEILDANGDIIADYFLQNRKSIELDQVSPWVIKATVDTEDSRFYQHPGVDIIGIARAIYKTIRGGGEGASTITQQLVRNTILSKEQFEHSIKRKVREAYIALEMEKLYTKEQILMMYLNTIYYGHGAYGIEAASQTYFSKHAKDLTLPEAALLSGLPQSPTYYNPTQDPELAVQRRNIVLERMLTMGDITEEECQKAQETPLKLKLEKQKENTGGEAPYFTQHVKQILEQDFDTNTILQGGLKIYTTLDPKVQKAAEDAVKKTLDYIGDDELQEAVVVMDPNNGYVKGLVGGRTWSNEQQFNIATQAKRQPGSTFKMFTLATAISEGMNPNILLNCNSPIRFSPTFNVQNDGNVSHGNISLDKATAWSSNTGFVQVAQTVGNDKIIATAKNMGIKENLPNYDSLTLGVKELTPLQLCEGYNTLASGGVHRDAIFITKIEDRNGNVVYEHRDNPSTALAPDVARATIKVLEGVVNYGSGSIIRSLTNINQPIAGKTGTSENARDLWWCGFTPQYTIVVWTGFNDDRPIRIFGSEGTSAQCSTRTFAYIIDELLSNTPRQEFKDAPAPHYKSNSSWTFSKTDSKINQPIFEIPKQPETPKEPEVTVDPKADPNAVTPGTDQAQQPDNQTNPGTPATPPNQNNNSGSGTKPDNTKPKKPGGNGSN